MLCGFSLEAAEPFSCRELLRLQSHDKHAPSAKLYWKRGLSMFFLFNNHSQIFLLLLGLWGCGQRVALSKRLWSTRRVVHQVRQIHSIAPANYREIKYRGKELQGEGWKRRARAGLRAGWWVNMRNSPPGWWVNMRNFGG